MFLLFHEIVLICLISAYWLTFMAAVMCATEEDGVAFAEVVSVPGWGQSIGQLHRKGKRGGAS